jgi:hypothetical protein
MKKLVFVFAVIFISAYGFCQELGCTVSQLRRTHSNLIEKTTNEDKAIGRQYFVYKEHPGDPNYSMLYAQDYEEEYFFINDKLYFIVQEYRAVENRWKYLLAGFMNEFKFTERWDTTPDRSWYIYNYIFYDDQTEHNVFIYIPSQRWKTVYNFAQGEAIVRIVSKHNQFLKEYQDALAKKNEPVINIVEGRDEQKDELKRLLSPYSDGIPINLNLSQLENNLKELGYKKDTHYMNYSEIWRFRKLLGNENWTWVISQAQNSIIKDEGVLLTINIRDYKDGIEDSIRSLYADIEKKINNLEGTQYVDDFDTHPYSGAYRLTNIPIKCFTGNGIEKLGFKEIILSAYYFQSNYGYWVRVHFNFI